MEIQDFEVTEADLDEAIKRRTDGYRITQNCVLALALQRQILKGARCGWSTVNNDAGAIIGTMAQTDTTRFIVNAFDDRKYEAVRASLPVTITFIPKFE